MTLTGNRPPALTCLHTHACLSYTQINTMEWRKPSLQPVAECYSFQQTRSHIILTFTCSEECLIERDFSILKSSWGVIPAARESIYPWSWPFIYFTCLFALTFCQKKRGLSMICYKTALLHSPQAFLPCMFNSFPCFNTPYEMTAPLFCTDQKDMMSWIGWATTWIQLATNMHSKILHNRSCLYKYTYI